MRILSAHWYFVLCSYELASKQVDKRWRMNLYSQNPPRACAVRSSWPPFPSRHYTGWSCLETTNASRSLYFICYRCGLKSTSFFFSYPNLGPVQLKYPDKPCSPPTHRTDGLPSQFSSSCSLTPCICSITLSIVTLGLGQYLNSLSPLRIYISLVCLWWLSSATYHHSLVGLLWLAFIFILSCFVIASSPASSVPETSFRVWYGSSFPKFSFCPRYFTIASIRPHWTLCLSWVWRAVTAVWILPAFRAILTQYDQFDFLSWKMRTVEWSDCVSPVLASVRPQSPHGSGTTSLVSMLHIHTWALDTGRLNVDPSSPS